MNVVKQMVAENIIPSERKIIAPYELNIYIPDSRVAIEYNGDYWHSNELLFKRHNMDSKTYHRMKERLCRNKNIELLYVWESDWRQKQEHIVKILKNFFVTQEIHKDLKKYEIRGE